MTSITLPVNGTLVTVLRNATPQGLRGDVVLRATGATSASLAVRQAFLQDGLLASEIDALDVTLALEPDRWILTGTDGDVLVFTAVRNGEHLELSFDPDDPRVTATNPPHAIVLDRVTPWTTTTNGAWELVSLTNASGTVLADTCTPAGSGWMKVTMAITIDDRQLFERVMTLRSYSDDTCATQVGATSSTQIGYGEEEGGTTLRIWGVEGDSREYQAFTLTHGADRMTLTRTACLPQPDCVAEAPTEVVVRRP